VEQWSWWCHTIPIVVANTSTINRTGTMTRQIRVGADIRVSLKRVYILYAASILNNTDALSNKDPPFDHLSFSAETGRLKGKSRNQNILTIDLRSGNL
jgi:hypothetical protein